jgi:hypothetical protein
MIFGNCVGSILSMCLYQISCFQVISSRSLTKNHIHPNVTLLFLYPDIFLDCVTTVTYSSYISSKTALPYGTFRHTVLQAVMMCAILQGTQIKFKSLLKDESWSQRSINIVVMRVQAGCSWIHILAGARDLSPKHPDQMSGSPIFLFNGYWG